jgi:hypothetical protein
VCLLPWLTNLYLHLQCLPKCHKSPQRHMSQNKLLSSPHAHQALWPASLTPPLLHPSEPTSLPDNLTNVQPSPLSCLNSGS